MPDFLLELRSEEIPARMQATARANLARLFAEQLAHSGLTAQIETHATPRRLALIARGLPDATQATTEERRGPRADAPAQALEGFLKSTGLTRDRLEERPDKKGIFLYAVLTRPGRPTADVLAEAVPTIVRGFPWPKSMRWGAASVATDSLRWVRPLQGIVALLGEHIVPFEIAGIHSGAATLGHRFHHPGIITIGSADDYEAKLRACHVILRADERADLIREGAEAAASAAGLTLVPDEGLVAENAGLTEWPVPLLGRFDPAYLDVPPEVIVLTMRTNQKYFACRDGEGRLAPAFVCTANIAATDGGQGIVRGNERVLSARLADAKFFWEADLKVPLESQAEKLDGIVFHEKLGTLADKVDRVAKLARWLIEEGIVGNGSTTPEPDFPELVEGLSFLSSSRTDGENEGLRQAQPSRALDRSALATLTTRAARLCKADLVTQMVGEFPELQGTIGAHLARAQGEPSQVADAIRDHYKPVGQGDEVPTAPVTVAVSLADKLDTLLEFYGVQMRPTGSRDPFAVRRAALAIIELLTGSNIRLPVRRLGNWFFWSQVRAWNETAGRRAYAWTSAYDVKLVDESGDEYNGRERTFFDIALHEEDLDQLELDHFTAHRVNYNDDGDGELEENVQGGRAYQLPDPRILRDEIVPFLADRLKVQQREAGVRHDLIDAVFALGGEDDLVRLLARVRALQAFVETPEGADLLAGYKRAANILKKEGYSPSPLEGEGPAARSDGRERGLSYTPEPAEDALMTALASAEPQAVAAVAREDFAAAMAALASLRAPVDAFFDTVTVNDPDPVKREARLALLARMRDAMHAVADFSKVEG